MNMTKTKVDTRMTDREIVRLFSEGLSIDMLSGRLAARGHKSEDKKFGTRKAKRLVTEAIYYHQMQDKLR